MIITILLILFTIPLLGQRIDSLLPEFYNKTLHFYFTEFLTDSTSHLHEDQDRFGNILVTSWIDASKLDKQIGQNVLLFIPQWKIDKGLINLEQDTLEREHYKVTHNVKSRDTVDIIISERTIKIERNEANININYSIGCGGILGYIPTGRFTYDNKRHKWIFWNWNEIMSEKSKIMIKKTTVPNN